LPTDRSFVVSRDATDFVFVTVSIVTGPDTGTISVPTTFTFTPINDDPPPDPP
jgi:hypothetical protein